MPPTSRYIVRHDTAYREHFEPFPALCCEFSTYWLTWASVPPALSCKCNKSLKYVRGRVDHQGGGRYLPPEVRNETTTFAALCVGNGLVRRLGSARCGRGSAAGEELGLENTDDRCGKDRSLERDDEQERQERRARRAGTQRDDVARIDDLVDRGDKHYCCGWCGDDCGARRRRRDFDHAFCKFRFPKHGSGANNRRDDKGSGGDNGRDHESSSNRTADDRRAPATNNRGSSTTARAHRHCRTCW